MFYYLGYCIMVLLTMARVSLYWTFAIIKAGSGSIQPSVRFIDVCASARTACFQGNRHALSGDCRLLQELWLGLVVNRVKTCPVASRGVSASSGMFMWFIPDVSSIGKGCFYCVFWPKKGQWPKEAGSEEEVFFPNWGVF